MLRRYRKVWGLEIWQIIYNIIKVKENSSKKIYDCLCLIGLLVLAFKSISMVHKSYNKLVPDFFAANIRTFG